MNRAILLVWCPFCGAPPGEWCHTQNRTRASYLHSKRFVKAVYAGLLPLVQDGELSGEVRD